jgi:glycosyltransferase involved in cell wall biosynthesis
VTFKKLSIVIPVYNEIDTLDEILKQVKEVEVGMEKEVVLIDDYSTDGTRERLRQIQLEETEDQVKVFFHAENRGKGAALRTGFQHVTGDITLIQDADLEYDPKEYPKLLEPILDGKADVVYGSRFLDNPHRVLFWHHLANKLLTFLSNMFTNLKLTDMETCYKVFKTSILKNIPLKCDRFGFEPEITAKIAKRRYRVYETPISYRGRDYAEGKKINWKDGVAAVYHIIRFQIKD